MDQVEGAAPTAIVEPKSILELPFHERRYIAVVSNDEFENYVNADDADDGFSAMWPVIGVIGATFMPGGLLMRGAALAASLIAAARSDDSAKPAEPAKPKPPAKKHRSDAIRVVSLSDANEFMFSAGSAEAGEIYAANPLKSSIYYPVETYPDDLVNHKISELERILHSLGAKHYSIKFSNSDGEGAGLLAGLKKHVVDVGVEAELERMRKRRFERSGTSDGKDPTLPDGLVWYHREPAWQALAESRLHHGRKEFSLTVDLEQSLKLSAKAITDLKALKFEVGAHAHRHSNFSLSVSGSF